MKLKIEPLIWSEAKPLHTGYYWLKYKQGEAAPRVVHVVANPHGELWADIGGRWDNTMINSRMFNGGLWAGPIPLPNDESIRAETKP